MASCVVVASHRNHKSHRPHKSRCDYCWNRRRRPSHQPADKPNDGGGGGRRTQRSHSAQPGAGRRRRQPAAPPPRATGQKKGVLQPRDTRRRRRRRPPSSPPPSPPAHPAGPKLRGAAAATPFQLRSARDTDAGSLGAFLGVTAAGSFTVRASSHSPDRITMPSTGVST